MRPLATVEASSEFRLSSLLTNRAAEPVHARLQFGPPGGVESSRQTLLKNDLFLRAVYGAGALG